MSSLERTTKVNGVKKTSPIVEEKVEVVVDTQTKEDTKEEIKNEDTFPEAPKNEIATSHPQGCEFFGTFDPTNRNCHKDCMDFSSDCVAACKAYTESLQVKPKRAKVAKTSDGTNPPARKATGPKGNKVMISGANSGCGKIELMIMRPEGAKMSEMMDVVGCAKGHVARLIKEGHPVVLDSGRYYHRILG